MSFLLLNSVLTTLALEFLKIEIRCYALMSILWVLVTTFSSIAMARLLCKFYRKKSAYPWKINLKTMRSIANSLPFCAITILVKVINLWLHFAHFIPFADEEAQNYEIVSELSIWCRFLGFTESKNTFLICAVAAL